MNKGNQKIMEALQELDAIQNSLMRRVMSDAIDDAAPNLVEALRKAHELLCANVPESEPMKIATEMKMQLDLL
jgi:hypothetical protein